LFWISPIVLYDYTDFVAVISPILGRDFTDFG